MPVGPDQLIVLVLALFGLLAHVLLKRGDVLSRRQGAGGSRAVGRVAVGPDPRRGSPLFDQDADR